jgi:hypothetical protein
LILPDRSFSTCVSILSSPREWDGDLNLVRIRASRLWFS